MIDSNIDSKLMHIIGQKIPYNIIILLSLPTDAHGFLFRYFKRNSEFKD